MIHFKSAPAVISAWLDESMSENRAFWIVFWIQFAVAFWATP